MMFVLGVEVVFAKVKMELQQFHEYGTVPGSLIVF